MHDPICEVHYRSIVTRNAALWVVIAVSATFLNWLPRHFMKSTPRLDNSLDWNSCRNFYISFFMFSQVFIDKIWGKGYILFMSCPLVTLSLRLSCLLKHCYVTLYYLHLFYSKLVEYQLQWISLVTQGGTRTSCVLQIQNGGWLFMSAAKIISFLVVGSDYNS